MPIQGELVVFEGIDGVGKSSILAEVARLLIAKTSRNVSRVAFPGRDPGTLGHHIYQLHHEPARFGIKTMSPTSLQLLHIAAHVDAVDNLIRPTLARGDLVLLDRYWWSTWVYGLVGGADQEILHSMIDVERRVWGAIRPTVVFLIRRVSAVSGGMESEFLKRRSEEYDKLAAAEGASVSVVTIENKVSVEASAHTVVSRLQEMLSPELR